MRIKPHLLHKLKTDKRKGESLVITQKELMLLDDFLSHVQTTSDIMNHVAAELTDSQAKQLCQQFAQRGEQHFQTMSKHLNAGQKM